VGVEMSSMLVRSALFELCRFGFVPGIVYSRPDCPEAPGCG
jgi:hypothetical protein